MITATETEPQSKYARWNEKLNASWSSADYGRIGVTLQITGEDLAEDADFRPGAKILDVAAGNGNASLAFARRFCSVTSTDYVPAMLDKGQRRAEAEGLDIDFQLADAQNLPFSDDAFDGVVSTFGVMFAPDQKSAASELVRVCKPGGKIALSCWTPSGFVGRVCAAIGRHMSASPGFHSPQNWGRQDWIKEHFGSACSAISIDMKTYNFRYRSPEHYLDFFRTHYGICRKAFEFVGPTGEAALASDILEIANEFNVADDDTMRAPSEYLQISMIKG
ncbi:MAG: class I SAM-dependent methyltransferase [Hyphomicrobiaceae bacterium]